MSIDNQKPENHILCEGGPLNGTVLDAEASFGPAAANLERFYVPIEPSETGATREALYEISLDGVKRDTPIFKMNGILTREDPFSDVRVPWTGPAKV